MTDSNSGLLLMKILIPLLTRQAALHHISRVNSTSCCIQADVLSEDLLCFVRLCSAS